MIQVSNMCDCAGGRWLASASPTYKEEIIVDIKDIARVTYDVNRAYCKALGDDSFGPWDLAPEWQKDANRAGVKFHLENPDASPGASHKSWFAQKVADGWKYGPVKDAEKKENPCMMPFAALPREQRAKDYLFKAVVDSLRGMLI